MSYDIHVEERAEQQAAVVHEQVALDELATFLGGAFEEVGKALADQGLHPMGPPFGRYRMVASGFDVAAGFPCSGEIAAVDRVEPVVLPGGQVATTVHTGSYDSISLAYQAVGEWLAGADLVGTGEPWESYLDGPEVAEPRTIVCFPCRKPSA